jgi:hypothetical protein
VTIPSEQAYRGDTVTATVSGHARTQIEAFDLKFAVGSGLSISSMSSANSAKYTITRTGSSVVGILKTTDYDSSEVDAEDLLTIKFKVESSASLDAAVSVDCTILQLLNVQQEDLFPKATYPDGKAAEFVDYTVTSAASSEGPRETGSIFVRNNYAVGLLAWVEYPQLVNLGALTRDGKTVSRSIKVYVAEPKSVSSLTQKDSGDNELSCGTDVDGITVSSCAFSVDGKAPLVSGAVEATVTWVAASGVDPLEATVAANVWSPMLPVNLTVSDTVLNAVDGFESGSDCAQQYQKG